MVVAAQITGSVPLAAWSLVASGARGATAEAAPVEPTRTLPSFVPHTGRLTFSETPTTDEIFGSGVFEEPLVPIGGDPSAAENIALAGAIERVHAGDAREGRAALGAFLVAHPATVWRASVLATLGSMEAGSHAYTRALESYDAAWRLAKDASGSDAKAVADFAISQAIALAASFGQLEKAETRIKHLGTRELSGAAAVNVSAARETLYMMRTDTEHVTLCGPAALMALHSHVNGVDVKSPGALTSFKGSIEGTSLLDLEHLADAAGMSLRKIKRDADAPIPVPSIVHWKIGHYATVVDQVGGRLRIVDRSRQQDYWIDQDTFVDESSDYFLVGEGATHAGWHAVSREEADTIVGSNGYCPPGSAPRAPPEDEEDPEQCKGMPRYRFQDVSASLLIHDSPIGYAPPRGPAVQFLVGYHQRDSLQPQTFGFSNLGPKWALNWVRFVKEETTNETGGSQAHAWVMLPPGGREVYVNPDSQGLYEAHWHSRAVLAKSTSGSPWYERRHPDGAVERYDIVDNGPAGQRRFFLSSLTDRLGLSLQFSYDSQFRLVAITDALGQVSTIHYELSAHPLRVTKITDPFARVATFAYNAAGQLESITDVLGLTSKFAYGSSDRIASMTTPYGTTSFRYEPTDLGSGYTRRFVEATDPQGATERVEFQWSTPSLPAQAPSNEVPDGFTAWNANLNRYNTFYWDKRAWKAHPGDLTKAENTHWLTHEEWANWQHYSSIPHSVKRPLEGRVWFKYPGQTAGSADVGGWWKEPTHVARRLDGGDSQVWEYTYNTQGSRLTSTDPLGRRTTFDYATNGVDLTAARQTTGSMNEQLAAFGNFTTLGQPQQFTDAAGQVSTMTYNAAGQILTATNALSETTTYGYSTAGYLTSVVGAMTGATTTLTYDSYGRPRTIVASDGYELTVDYDVFDRVTKVTYPDGTYEARTYDRLSLSSVRDRKARVTRFFYDALQRLTAARDPLGRTTAQEWCGCGALDSLTDANGNRTRWERDLQGRVTSEIRPNNGATQFAYETLSGRLVQRVDSKSQQTNYQYFIDDALKQVSYANASTATPIVAWTYDAAYGRVATMADGLGTTAYTYKPVGSNGATSIDTIDGPLTNDTIAYSYDVLGRVSGRTLNSTSSSWTYDALGRLATQVDPIGTFAYSYVGATGRLQQLAYPNGQTSTYAYQPNTGDRRLQEIHHKTSTGATLSKFGYAYDAVGNITTWMQQHEAVARAYDFAYDSVDQLVGATYRTTDVVPSVLARYGYVYDKVGNRTTEQVDDAPRAWAYNNTNQMITQGGGGTLRFEGTVSEPATVTVQGQRALVDGANGFAGVAIVGAGTPVVTVTATDGGGNSSSQAYEVDVTDAPGSFIYDLNGNLTTHGTKTYEWDAENRLVRALDNSVEVARFTYDGLGRRAEKISGGVTRAYVYDGEDIVEERAGGTTTRIVHGPGIDQPLAAVTGSTPAYYLADHLGSIAQHTNSAQQVTLTRTYDPFGNMTSGASNSGYSFTGREWDGETGLYYYRARYYDAGLGRFISADPSGFIDGPNIYSYVRNMPHRYVDPSGRQAAAAILGGAARGAAKGARGGVLTAVAGALLGGVLAGLSEVLSENSSDVIDIPDAYPPFKGEPGTTVRGERQTTRYGPDGYPETQSDPAHHGKPGGEVHDWGRPADGGPPTKDNRGPSRPRRPDDPPAPRCVGK